MVPSSADPGGTSESGNESSPVPARTYGPEEVEKAQGVLRHLLGEVHVLDVLPERSRMLAVDAELPVHTVLATVLAEQHPHPQPARGNIQPGLGSSEMPMPMRREGWSAGEEARPPALRCGQVPPGLPSNVLAEVCEFDSAPSRLPTEESLGEADAGGADLAALRRQWTSPDDGWGTHLASFPMQDLAKMPMGVPVTIGEFAEFLLRTVDEAPPPEADGAAQADTARWAQPAGVASADTQEIPTTPDCDPMDWSLSQWRAHRVKAPVAEAGAQADGAGAEGDTSPEAKTLESVVRLFVEDNPRTAWPVLVHRVPLAPSRPILCTDDPEASLLKAIELLLAYPELDALPIVSPARCTVVAHLTLSYCLAYTLPRMRGVDLLPLSALAIGGSDEAAADVRKFDRQAFEKGSAEAPPLAGAKSPVVLSQTQTLRDLLSFFALTLYSGVPIVEDNGSGGVVGLVSRRDLLNFLDIAMQSAALTSTDRAGGGGTQEDRVDIDLGAPIQAMLEVLRRYRAAPPEEPSSSGTGAMLVNEKELSLKVLPLRLLAAENRKLLFVQDSGVGKAPKLRRIVSASDVWRMLIGRGETKSKASS